MKTMLVLKRLRQVQQKIHVGFVAAVILWQGKISMFLLHLPLVSIYFTALDSSPCPIPTPGTYAHTQTHTWLYDSYWHNNHTSRQIYQHLHYGYKMLLYFICVPRVCFCHSHFSIRFPIFQAHQAFFFFHTNFGCEPTSPFYMLFQRNVL